MSKGKINQRTSRNGIRNFTVGRVPRDILVDEIDDFRTPTPHSVVRKALAVVAGIVILAASTAAIGMFLFKSGNF